MHCMTEAQKSPNVILSILNALLFSLGIGVLALLINVVFVLLFFPVSIAEVIWEMFPQVKEMLENQLVRLGIFSLSVVLICAYIIFLVRFTLMNKVWVALSVTCLVVFLCTLFLGSVLPEYEPTISFSVQQLESVRSILNGTKFVSAGIGIASIFMTLKNLRK